MMMTRLFVFAFLVSSLAAETPIFPKRGTEKRVRGELVSADFVHRTGEFRSEDGSLHSFTLIPSGVMHYRGSEADLREVPLGTQMTFLLLPDEDGQLTQLITTETDQQVDEEQRQRFIDFTKARGVAGRIDKTEDRSVTLTFFSSDPDTFKQTWMDDFAQGKNGGKLCVANDELRTWNPHVDGEAFTVMEVNDVPNEGFGCSGVQVVLKITNMLEGFRKGRIVRVFAPGWKAKDQFYGESLMGYGFGRMLNQELIENAAKEYPEQFPFRTDFSNRDLSWFQLEPGVKPPPFSEHLVLGELMKVDAATGSGQFKMDRSGDLVDFTLIPESSVQYLNAEAKLSDLPLGQRYRFHLYEDDQGAFTKTSLISDEFSRLASNAITLRIKAMKLDQGKLDLAWQLPLVKDYNGDMQRPPDFGQSVLQVNDKTRVWKGEKQVSLADLAVDDVLLINVTAEAKDQFSYATDIWVGEDTHKLVSEAQKKKAGSVAKR